LLSFFPPFFSIIFSFQQLTIVFVKVALDGEGKSKGYGYVHFETEEGAKAAIDRMDEIEICGQKVCSSHFLSSEIADYFSFES